MRIPEAPLHRLGFYEARPLDVVDRDDLLIVDVRPEEDLLGSMGHIHGVKHVPLTEVLRAGLPEIAADAAVVVVCGNGRESRRGAAHLATERGFAEVYHLVGGMLRWTAEDRPVARVRTWT